MSPAGERIRTARILLGISQEELATATSRSKQQIGAVENGTRKATDELLEAVAAVTALPLTFFTAVPPDLPPASLRFRKLATAKRSDSKRAEALLGEAYRVISRLATDAKLPAPRLPSCTRAPSPDEIEDIATDARLLLGIGSDGPVQHVTRAFERAGIAVVPLSLPGDDESEGETVGHFGASFWPAVDELALVGFFPGGAGDRLRYTLAHELAHLMLHSRRRFVEDAEGEANRFAGAFLLPRDRMMEAMQETPTLTSLKYMKAHWGVSMQAIIMRGAHLGLIDENRKRSLFKQLSARQWRKTEPVTVHREEPLLVWRLLVAKYGEKSVYQRATNSLGLGPMFLRGLAPQPAT